MKNFLFFFFAILFNIAISSGIAMAADLPLLPVFGTISLAAFIPKPAGILGAGVYKEIWTGEMVKRFGTGVATFLKGIKSYNHLVENDVIHLIDIGSLPDVLVNNTSFPLTPQNLSEADIPIPLDKLETVPTAISAAELHGISYDKINVAHDLHREALEIKAGIRAAHAIAPDSHTANSPIVKTTGSNNGANFKQCRVEDIIALKKLFDKLDMPKVGRVLVLSTDHVNDLLLTSQTFKDQYYNISNGATLTQLFGFEIHEFNATPVYNTGFTKIELGTTPAATDRSASVAYYNPYIWQARGSIQPYISLAKNDVLNKRNLCSFDLYYKCRPKVLNYGVGAIVSDTAA